MDRYTRFHLGKAELLIAAGKKAEARKVLGEFNTLRIPIGEKGRWLKKFEQLENQAKEE